MKIIKNTKFLYVFVLLTITFSRISAQNLDINTLRDINVHRNKNLDPAFTNITNSIVYVSLAAPIITYSVAWINEDVGLKQKGIFIGQSLLVVGFTTIALKNSIKRERPFVGFPEIENSVAAGSYSMPSGHTSLAFQTATSLSLAFPKWYVIAPSFLYAGLVGYSRMHLGVHYPSDVLVGALLGSASAYVVLKVNKILNRKLHKPVFYDAFKPLIKEDLVPSEIPVPQ